MFPRHKNIVSSFISMLSAFMILFFFSCNPQKPGESVSEKATVAVPSAGEIDRTVLPIKEPIRQRSSELDARNATPLPGLR